MKTLAFLYLLGFAAVAGYQIRRCDLDKRLAYAVGDAWDELNRRAARAHFDEMKRLDSLYLGGGGKNAG